MFGRLSCHFCGKRSKHSRGTTEFQCTQCEALNFFDVQGQVVDTPYTISNQPQQHRRETAPYKTFGRPGPREHEQQQSSATVCQRCLNNQQMYMESLNNYLPDLEEDDPIYGEYIEKLPQFKAQLEKKYPQVCKKCASKVQTRIHKADHFGLTQNVELNMRRSSSKARSRGQSPVGRRDDWAKWTVRLFLSLLGVAIYGSLLLQAAWHAYGAFAAVLASSVDVETDDLEVLTEPFRDSAFPLTLQECAVQSKSLDFVWPCYDMLGAFIPKALLLNFCLLWYNPGIKLWYDRTYRVSRVHGQKEYCRVQLIMLVVRLMAWQKLSDPAFTAALGTYELLAAHGFMVAFMMLAQRISERPIKFDLWKVEGKIMPKPEQTDMFGATAGPADETYTRQASSMNPFKLFGREGGRFPTENLAPKPRTTRGYSKLDLPSMPSPPDTQSDSENGDAMEIDDPPRPVKTAGMPGVPIDRRFNPTRLTPPRPQTRSIYNHDTTQPTGWGAMRNEVFGMQDQMRAEEVRKQQVEEEKVKLSYQPPVEQTPFRGRLPQAPMSMGRRLRNPPTQVQFKQTPVTKQQDFMQQMRDSFEHGRTFGGVKKDPQAEDGYKPRLASRNLLEDDDDDDFSPAKSRTKGGLELKPSTWHLPGDGMAETGLEDLLGRGFSLADSPEKAQFARTALAAQRSETRKLPWLRMFVVVAPILLLTAAWNIMAIRRPICLWLVRKLEGLGV